MTGVCTNRYSNTYVLRHQTRVLNLNAVSSLVAPLHVQVSTRKRRKSDGESWIECGRRIVRAVQRVQ